MIEQLKKFKLLEILISSFVAAAISSLLSFIALNWQINQARRDAAIQNSITIRQGILSEQTRLFEDIYSGFGELNSKAALLRIQIAAARGVYNGTKAPISSMELDRLIELQKDLFASVNNLKTNVGMIPMTFSSFGTGEIQTAMNTIENNFATVNRLFAAPIDSLSSTALPLKPYIDMSQNLINKMANEISNRKQDVSKSIYELGNP